MMTKPALFLYRVYQVVFMVPVLVVYTILETLFTFLCCLVGLGRWAGYYPQSLWGRMWCWLAFVRVSVDGRSNIRKGRAYLFVANHQSAYDIFSIYGWLGHDFRWMMKQSLRRIPLVGFACAATHQIFVDNSSVKGIRRTMHDAEAELRKGMSLVVFPEGARTPDGHLHRFKKGAYKLAVEFNLPVVPVTIEGAYSVMPRTARLPRPGRIRITIHEPIEPGVDGHSLDDVMERSRGVIASSLGEA